MSGIGRTRSDTAAAGNSEGGLSSPATPVLTAKDIQAIIVSALRQQEENWSASGRLLPAGGNVNIENVETISVAESISKSVRSYLCVCGLIMARRT